MAPLTGQVVRTEHVFAGLRCVTAYPTGVSLSVVLAVRRGDLPYRRWQALEASVWGSDEPSRSAAPGTGGPRWAVELADGQQVSIGGSRRHGPDGVPEGAVPFRP